MALSFTVGDKMNIENEAVSTMAKEIYKLIKKMTEHLSYDKTKRGRIVSHIEGGFYEVQLDGNVYKAYSPTFIYKTNDIVYVKIAENNYNNLIIECAIR